MELTSELVRLEVFESVGFVWSSRNLVGFHPRNVVLSVWIVGVSKRDHERPSDELRHRPDYFKRLTAGAAWTIFERLGRLADAAASCRNARRKQACELQRRRPGQRNPGLILILLVVYLGFAR